LSPAHFNDEERKKELALWDDRHIESRSYATLGKRPFQFEPGRLAPPCELAKPWTYPEIAKDTRLSARTDIVYRICYRACAGGPLEWPALSGKVTRRLSVSPPPAIEP